MTAYHVCVVLHLLALCAWIGHMVFWSVVVGPVVKRHESPDTADAIRAASSRFGGLGWPALSVLVVTGIVMLHARGFFAPGGVGKLWSEPGGRAFALKLLLVGGMILYQWRVGHRPAPKLIYVNMLAAFAIVALSVLFLRLPDYTLPWTVR